MGEGRPGSANQAAGAAPPRPGAGLQACRGRTGVALPTGGVVAPGEKLVVEARAAEVPADARALLPEPVLGVGAIASAAPVAGAKG